MSSKLVKPFAKYLEKTKKSPNICGPMCIKNQSALHFVKTMVGFQFHFNRLNGVVNIVDEKKCNILTICDFYGDRGFLSLYLRAL